MQQNGPVMIRLEMTIEDQGEKEYSKTEHAGEYFEKQPFHVLKYEEELDTGERIHNQITIQPKKVIIKRTGGIAMTQQFMKEKMTEGVYEHPHGNFHMETFTNRLKHSQFTDSEQGELHLMYTVKLNGMNERKHKLKLTYQREAN